MNAIVKKALVELEALPLADQEELGQTLYELALRRKVAALLIAAEARGGETEHDELVKELTREKDD